ncbi:ABC transporter permease [Candidatus Amarolinea dominans]|uniref:ABC transporter permease n=1 Tax=Candidatus Amarolinea dominans TaxID=3140696 RepID=UPI003135C99A|nr:ABC transporter permease [Anaerolineae bacterium]
MTLNETLRVAWEGLKLNRVRSFLTTLGVIIGVASVIIMLAVSAGAEAAIADQINALGANLIIVNPVRGVPGASQTLTYDDALAIKEAVSNSEGVSAEFQVVQDTSTARARLEGITVLGVTADFPIVRDYAVGEGRFFTADENERKLKVVVLGYGMAQDLFGSDSAIGQVVTVGSTRLTVVGVMEEKGVVADVDYDGRLYIPLQLLYQKFSPSVLAADRVRTIYIKAESQEAMTSVTNQIKALLVERHDVDPAKPDFVLQTQQDIISTQQATTEAFRDLLAWVAAISLLVGGIGIMNIMLVSVTERTREIGLRQALGARPRDVLLQFLIEAVTLSLVGGLAGVILGIGGAELFGQLGDMQTQIVPVSVPLAFGAAAAVGIFFGYYPATKAAQLDPIVALRHE